MRFHNSEILVLQLYLGTYIDCLTRCVLYLQGWYQNYVQDVDIKFSAHDTFLEQP